MKLTQAIRTGGTIFFAEIGSLVRDPVFVFVTMLGNACILFSGVVFYLLEVETNPNLHDWLDSFYWAFATVTTVGYGDIVAVTVLGKALSVVLMIVGTGLFWTYAALFAGALVRNAGFNPKSENR